MSVQQDKQAHKKQSKKRNQQLSTIIENGDSYAISPKHKKKDLQDLENTPRNITETIKRDSIDLQQTQKDQLQIQLQGENSQKPEQNEIELVQVQNSKQESQPKKKKSRNNDLKKENQKSNSQKISNPNDQNENTTNKEQKIIEKPKKKMKFFDEEMIQNISNMSLSNIPLDDEIDIEQKTGSMGVIKEYEISWNVYKFFLDSNIKLIHLISYLINIQSYYKLTFIFLFFFTFFINFPLILQILLLIFNFLLLTIPSYYLPEISCQILYSALIDYLKIRLREKFLFFISTSLILSDIGASVFVFYNFVNTPCFGYEAETEFSDIINIIISVVLKVCCINIIMQEITNTLPGNLSIPFLIPVSIIGITPNFQLNQYVYSFTNCIALNPVMSYKNAKAITRLLSYLFIALIGLICILVMIIRIEISRQTWKRLKNIGFYVIIGGFFLSLIFVFVFVSVLQIKKEVVLSLCLDNVTFWIFFFICTFYTVRKIHYKKEPFPFIPSIVQEVNSNAELYAKTYDIEQQRLTVEDKPQIPNLKKKIENQIFKEDMVMGDKNSNIENLNDNNEKQVKIGKNQTKKQVKDKEHKEEYKEQNIENKSKNVERKEKNIEIKQKVGENKPKSKERKIKNKRDQENLFENAQQNDNNKQEIGKEKLKKAIKTSKYDNIQQKDEIKEGVEIVNNEEKPRSKRKIVFSPEVQKFDDEDKLFSFNKMYLNAKLNISDAKTDSQGKMTSSTDKFINKQGDDYSLPESVQDDAATCSSIQGRQKLKFSHKSRRPFESPIFRPVLDDGKSGDDSQPNSKSSLSRRHHDNFSLSSKSSLKDDNQYLNQSKSFGNLINQDQSDNLTPSSLSEFQRRDLELFAINKPKSLFYINNNDNDNDHQNQKGSKDDLRPRIRSLNKLAEDDELSEQQIRKYSQPHSDNGDNHASKPYEVKKKSLFEKHVENIENPQNGE